MIDTERIGLKVRVLSRIVRLSILATPVIVVSFLNACNGKTITDDISAIFEEVKSNPVRLRNFLQKYPKGGDLHNHLSGAFYAESFIELAISQGMCVHPVSKTLSAPPCKKNENGTEIGVLIGEPPSANKVNEYGIPNLTEIIDQLSVRDYGLKEISGHDQFFSTFGRFSSLVPGNRGDIVAEVTTRASRQNILYLELMQSLGMFEVANWAATEYGTTSHEFTEILDHNFIDDQVSQVTSTLDQIESRRREIQKCKEVKSNRFDGCDVEVRYLAQVIRTFSPVQVYAQTVLAFKLIDADSRVVGLNFVAPEDDPIALRDYRLHMSFISDISKQFKNSSNGIALHAGELTLGLVPPKHLGWHVRAAIMIAGAKRIGHGIDIAYEDDLNELLEHMAKHSIAVEINLTSNDVILGISGVEHPFKTYMEYGVPLTISTDDEGVSRIDLTNEYSRAVTEYDLDYKTIRSLSRNAIQYSFLQGAPLFKDTLTGEVIDECSEDKNTDEEILTDRCEHFLSTSSKARMQWQLEQKISLFEQAVRI
jgi:adenosine deaminase